MKRETDIGAGHRARNLRLSVIGLAGWTAACALAGGFGLLLAKGQVGLIWPLAGVGVAALLVGGLRLWPAVAIGAAAVELYRGGGALSAGIVAAATLAEALLGAWLLTRRLAFGRVLETGADALKFVLAGAILPAAAAASLHLASGFHAASDPALAWLAWWARDTLGILFFAPPILAWRGFQSQPVERMQALGIGLLLAAYVSLGLVMFSGVVSETTALYLVWFGLFPLAVSTSALFRPREVSALNLALAVTVLWVSPPTLLLSGAALATEGFLGAVALATLTLSAVTFEQRRTKEGLQLTEDRMRELLSLTSDWYWEQDEEFRFTYQSEGLLQRAGMAAVGNIGRRRWEIAAPNMSQADWARHRAQIERHEPFHDLELLREGKDGGTRWASISGRPVFDTRGRFRGYRGIGKDITERKLAETEILSAKERLERALEASSLSLWDTDLHSGEVFLTEGWAEFMGMPPAPTRTSVEALSQLAHPDDLPEVMRLSSEAIRGVRAEYSEEHRVRMASGEYKWVLSRGRVTERDAAGRALRMSGTNLDITERKLAEAELARANERLQLALDGSRLAIWDTNLLTGSIYLSESWSAMLGGERRVTSSTKEDITRNVHPDDVARVLQASEDTVKGLRTEYDVEHRFRALNGEWRWVHSRGRVTQRDPATGRALRMVGTTVDITLRRRAEEALSESERRFSDVVEASGEYVWELDRDGRFVYVSGRAEAVLGRHQGELLGHRPAEFMPPEDASRVQEWLATDSSQPFRELEHQTIRGDGRVIWQSISGMPVRDVEGRITGFRGTGRDITDRKGAEQRIEELATRDTLTGLPNRVLFTDRLAQALINAQRNRDMLGLLFIDLDHFKTINDSLGHATGDSYLQEVAYRLGTAMRKGDSLARLGGDEFVAITESLRHADDAGLVAQKVLASLEAPIRVGDHILNASCSIGVSIYPADGSDVSTLLKNADLAMYSAKEHGRSTYRFYSQDMNARAMERLRIENHLRDGLANQEFELYYQPKVGLSDERVTGAEALLRWRRADKMDVAPFRFIAVAEETGLIQPLGEWVLRAACEQVRDWGGGGPPRVAVNCSARQFTPLLVGSVENALSASGIAADRLEIEITESVLMQNVDENVAILRRLADLGVQIAIDDFGTGYSSLGYLRRLKFDTLKIDRTFVKDMATEPGDVAIILAIVALGHSLRVKVIAEGVETIEQRDMLRSLGCDEYQGYLSSVPLPAAEFMRLYSATPA